MRTALSVALYVMVLLGAARVLDAQSAGAVNELRKAARSRDIGAFLEAARTLLREEPSPGAVRHVVTGFGTLLKGRHALSPDDYHDLHFSVARLLSDVDGAPGIAEIRRLQKEAREWQARVVLLDVAALTDRIDLLESALTGLADRDPPVIRRALVYLSRAEELRVVEAILQRFLEIDKKRSYRGDEWDLTRLSFQGALRKLLKVSLPAAVDYQNYLSTRRNSPNLFHPPEARESGRTRLTLFGAEVSGNHIVFVIDVSGSMMATDRITFKDDGDRGKTVVGRAEQERLLKQKIEEHRRINRAKRELTRVVQALPDDKEFNIIAYSTEVLPWKRKLAPTSKANRKSALDYINAMRAEGITVTDLALEAAFENPAVDTIYLITDGAPTHVGSRGPEKPRDADDLIRAIHKRVKVLNFLRDVRIFTIGFPDAEEEFLRKLADDNSGTYHPIR